MACGSCGGKKTPTWKVTFANGTFSFYTKEAQADAVIAANPGATKTRENR